MTKFETYFNTIDKGQPRKDFIDIIGKACNLSVPTFYNRLKNPDLFSPVEKAHIAVLSGKHVNDLF
jgi:hypothetical protein